MKRRTLALGLLFSLRSPSWAQKKATPRKDEPLCWNDSGKLGGTEWSASPAHITARTPLRVAPLQSAPRQVTMQLETRSKPPKTGPQEKSPLAQNWPVSRNVLFYIDVKQDDVATIDTIHRSLSIMLAPKNMGADYVPNMIRPPTRPIVSKGRIDAIEVTLPEAATTQLLEDKTLEYLYLDFLEDANLPATKEHLKIYLYPTKAIAAVRDEHMKAFAKGQQQARTMQANQEAGRCPVNFVPMSP